MSGEIMSDDAAPGHGYLKARSPNRFSSKRRAQAEVVALEPRLLLAASPNLVTNPDFTAFEPGSTTVTATLTSGDHTDGLGSPASGGLPVFGGSGFATVQYSDGTSGTAVDVPGWTASNSQGAVGVFQRNTYSAYIGNIDGTSTQVQQVSQTLSISLQPNTTYTLSFQV